MLRTAILAVRNLKLIEMKKLISMTDFVLEQSEILHKEQKNRNFNLGMLDFATNSIKYARFLKQPLELWMFVPCKLVGNEFANWQPMQEPESLKGYYETNSEGMKQESILRQEYQQAKERCLFKIYSFEEECDDFWYFAINELTLIGIDKVGTIEDLVKYNLQLTQAAQKQLGWI